MTRMLACHGWGSETSKLQSFFSAHHPSQSCVLISREDDCGWVGRACSHPHREGEGGLTTGQPLLSAVGKWYWECTLESTCSKRSKGKITWKLCKRVMISVQENKTLRIYFLSEFLQFSWLPRGWFSSGQSSNFWSSFTHPSSLNPWVGCKDSCISTGWWLAPESPASQWLLGKVGPLSQVGWVSRNVPYRLEQRHQPAIPDSHGTIILSVMVWTSRVCREALK